MNPSESPTRATPDSAVVEKWKKFDGQKISSLKFVGLKRTRETACRWLMKSLEGETFSSFQFAMDLQTLANTDDLYEITSEVTPDPQILGDVQLVVSVNDKWSIFPVVEAEGGGGSVSYRLGAFEANLLGTFTQLEVTVLNYDGIPSYDVNLFNEFIAGTDTMGYLDWSNSVFPTNSYFTNGNQAGSFTWQRQQEEVMAGWHLAGPIRISLFADTYFDSMLNTASVNAAVYSGIQYRFHPQIIFGRVNIIDFQEEGYELTIQPTAANFFGPVGAYQGATLQYKYVARLGRNNVAIDVFGGIMNPAPAPYYYSVGGYTNIRGYADGRQSGPYTAVGHLEYRPYVFDYNFRKFLGLIEVDDVTLQGVLFSDYGSAWGDASLTGDPTTAQFHSLWSAGVGARVNLLHFSYAILRMDLARTIQPDEGWGMSFGVGELF